MIFRRTRLFFMLIFIIYFAVSLQTVQLKAQQSGQSRITGINVNVNEVNNTTEIQIESDSPLSYTIYKPADPYRVIVELQEVDLGEFKDKIVFDRAGVMEIVPSAIEGSAKGAKLEIILSVPADIKPVQRDKTLVLAFYNPEAEGTVVASAVEGAEGIGSATVIENIELARAYGKIQVVITGDGKMSPEIFRAENNRLIVDIPGVSSKVGSLKMYDPPVLGLRVGEQPDKTRIVIDLLDSAKHSVSEEGNQVILSFVAIPEAEMEQVAARTEKKADISVAAGACDSAGTIYEGRIYRGKSKKYYGEKISIDFQDADLIHIFRLIADVSGCNIVVSPMVKGKFSMKLANVPWDQALDVILRNYTLSKTVEDNIIRIAPTSVLVREEEEIAKAKEAQEKSGDLITKIYPINYADVEDIKKAIDDAGILTKRGFLSTDERTSSLIIKDVEDRHPQYEELISSLDKATPQVAIEAKIVEVTTNFTHEFGIQWGVLWQPTPETRVSSTATDGSGFFSGNPLVVNLPAAAGAGSGATLGFGYISANDLRALDLQLSAMESSGKGKIISNPRIITMDNHQATIQQGKSIPYQSVSSSGTQTQFVDANLELTVTPHITPEGTIVMDINTKKNEADFSQTVNNVPTIDTKEAKSQVLIKDGDTLVMGGIFKTNISSSVASVPLLGKIPILGWLFKKEKEIKDTTELLIFITPRMIK